MAVRTIIEHPDQRLRRHAKRVTDFAAPVTALVDDLLDTLRATGGIGLCAPQIGVNLSVLVTDLSGDGSQPQVHINPELLQRSRPGIVEESCLSLPGVSGKVVRATRIRVRSFDATGTRYERELEGMHAVCLQHEMDHLVGTLFIDRLSLYRRLRLRAAAALAARRAARTARIAAVS